MKSHLVIHGHFYQPPRENPWTQKIDKGPGCDPYPNWNEKIYAECYRPNTEAEIVDEKGRVQTRINNFEWINFNVGPTLFNWFDAYHPDTSEKIKEADRNSMSRNAGHGNAIAQAYHHSILPLCSDEDRKTQIHWGKADFIHRFKRDPEAMWLPETAINYQTLSDLIQADFKYLILSPHQADQDNVDTSVPYYVVDPNNSQKKMAVFFYDGAATHAMAFGNALRSSQIMMSQMSRSSLAHVVTDGETFGHHYKFGDRTLAHVFQSEAKSAGYQLINYGAFLEKLKPQREIKLKNNSSWSCVHGLDRWQRNCGCQTGGESQWDQKWREPLREAFELLKRECDELFFSKAKEYFSDPWKARNRYIQVLNKQTEFNRWYSENSAKTIPAHEMEFIQYLFELQRYAMLMFTSCGWFFSDLNGIETRQILTYSGRVVELLRQFGDFRNERKFLDILAQAKSHQVPGLHGNEIFINNSQRN